MGEIIIYIYILYYILCINSVAWILCISYVDESDVHHMYIICINHIICISFMEIFGVFHWESTSG